MSQTSVGVELRRFLRRRLAQFNRGCLETVVWLVARPRGDDHSPVSPRSIFVLRNNDVGDVLLVTPLFEALRRTLPGARIVAGVGAWGEAVLLHNPYLDGVMTVNAPWFNRYTKQTGPVGRLMYLLRSSELRELAERRFEVGIDVLGSGWGSLLLARAKIPWRFGIHGYAGGHTGLHASVRFDPLEHVGRGALRFAELFGARDLPNHRPQIFLSPTEQENGEDLWGPKTGGRIVVGPGAGLVVKCWPPGHFRRVIQQLSESNAGRIAILGGVKERRVVEQFGGLSSHVTLFPDLGLRAVFSLVASADLVICNSSMLMHVAAAFSKPTIVTLGPAFPSAREHDAQWGYPGIAVSLGMERGLRNCMASPDEVVQLAWKLLSSASNRAV